jgi:nicotinate-nucleotide adenylyltransferase
MDIGIFGGSFNPIHIGHLIVAEEVFLQRALSKVIFVPTGISPHKEPRDLVVSFHRYQMVSDAISDNNHFEISDLEIKRLGRSYTVDTIRIFKEIFGETNNLFLIVGTDMMNEISSWKDISTLSQLCSFIMVNRSPTSKNGSALKSSNNVVSPNGNESDSVRLKKMGIFSDEKVAEMERLKVTIPPIGISSTEIRDRVYNGRSIRYLVPRCVEDYIKNHHLYAKR